MDPCRNLRFVKLLTLPLADRRGETTSSSSCVQIQVTLYRQIAYYTAIDSGLRAEMYLKHHSRQPRAVLPLSLLLLPPPAFPPSFPLSLSLSLSPPSPLPLLRAVSVVKAR